MVLLLSKFDTLLKTPRYEKSFTKIVRPAAWLGGILNSATCCYYFAPGAAQCSPLAASLLNPKHQTKSVDCTRFNQPSQNSR